MSQNSLVIPTTGTLSGLSLVTDVNSALDTLNTLNSGGSGPSTTEADMLWADTTNGLIKQRDGGNANWYPQWVRGVPHGGGMRHSGESAAITSSSTLTSAVLGQYVVFNPSAGITTTLPLAATFPAGTGFIAANYGAGKVTFATQGSDTTDSGAYLSGGIVGDQLMVISNGSNKWRFAFRSTINAASFGSNGYYGVAGGAIEQYGQITIGANSTAVFTFPTAFPNNCLNAIATPIDSGTSVAYRISVTSPSTTSVTLANSASIGIPCYVRALGN